MSTPLTRSTTFPLDDIGRYVCPSWPVSIKKDLTQKVLPASAPVESYLDAAARQIGTDSTNDFVFGPPRLR